MTLDLQPIPAASHPLLIAGPCSAETEEQVLEAARRLAQLGVRIFRAGVWKPRTMPGQFEGNGAKALPWLKAVKEQTGMLIATEVATPEHVEQALESGVDMLWIGARTTVNPFAVQAIADCLQGKDVPVLVKNPINPDLDLWIGALQRLNGAGIKRLAAVHRGFSCQDAQIYRNPPMWQIPIELRLRIPEIPIICDPSHIGGSRELIAPISQQAMDLGFDGLMVESHCHPDEAWSDARQQVTPERLLDIFHQLRIPEYKPENDDIQRLRLQIDDIDEQLIELLSRRFSVCREIGQYKKANNMVVLQTMRYSQMLERRSEQGSRCGVGEAFVKRIFDVIHKESVRQQMDIVDK